MIEGLFDGGAGKGLLVMLGGLAALIIAAITKVGYRKYRDFKDKTGL